VERTMSSTMAISYVQPCQKLIAGVMQEISQAAATGDVKGIGWHPI